MTPDHSVADLLALLASWMQRDALAHRSMIRWAIGVAGDERIAQSGQQVQQVLSDFRRPLRIAICGENNGGKSTLINALVGENIAVTNFFEATFCPMVFQYAPLPRARIEFSSGTHEECGVQSLTEMLRAIKQNGREAQVERVIVQLPLARLRDYELADVPGVGADARNAAVARAFHQRVDAACFVINSSLLGQTELNRDIRHLAMEFGAVAIVMNKLDQIGFENTDRACEFVKTQDFGRDIPVYPMAAGIVTGDAAANSAEQAQARQWLGALERDFLEPVAQNAATVKAISALARSEREMGSAVITLQAAYSTATREVDAFDSLLEQLESHRRPTIDRILVLVDRWLEEAAFSEQLKQFLDQTRDNPSKDFVERYAADCFSTDLAHREIRTLIKLVNDSLQSQWMQLDQQIGQHLRSRFFPFQVEITSRRLESMKQYDAEAIIPKPDRSLLSKSDIAGAGIGAAVGTALSAIAQAILLINCIPVPILPGWGVAAGFGAIWGGLWSNLGRRNTGDQIMSAERISKLATKARSHLGIELRKAAFPDGLSNTLDQQYSNFIAKTRAAAKKNWWPNCQNARAETADFLKVIKGGEALLLRTASSRRQLGHAASVSVSDLAFAAVSAAASRARLLFASPRCFDHTQAAAFWEALDSIIASEDIQLDIVDRGLPSSALVHLLKVPTATHVRILTYDVELSADSRSQFVQALRQLRSQRTGGVSVRIIKHANENRTPLDRVLIGGSDWLLECDRSLSHLGNGPVTIRLRDTEQAKADRFQTTDQFWSVDFVRQDAQAAALQAVDI